MRDRLGWRPRFRGRPGLRLPWPRRAQRVPAPASGDTWAWVEPYPGPFTDPPAPSMSLAFIAALQRLPPDERAALVLSDVLDFGPAEVADILGCEPPEVDRLLTRARAAVAGVLPHPAPPPQDQSSPSPSRPAPPRAPKPEDDVAPRACPAPPWPTPPADRTGRPTFHAPSWPTPLGDDAARAARPGADPAASDEDAILARFTAAFNRGDVSGITALLADDAWLRMRPLPVQYQGRGAAGHFLAAVAFPGGTTRYRLVVTRANGQPAFGCYLRDAAAGVDRACGLVVLTLDGGRITAIDRFVDNSALGRFGLPRTLPPATPR